MVPDINDILDNLLIYYGKEVKRIASKKTSKQPEKEWMLKISKCLIEVSKEFARQRESDIVSQLSEAQIKNILKEIGDNK